MHLHVGVGWGTFLCMRKTDSGDRLSSSFCVDDAVKMIHR